MHSVPPSAARIVPVSPEAIADAAALLRLGRLVAFPTETVYGLGADATSDKAVARIYAAKGRPDFNPLIIHVADTDALDALIEWTPTARLLAGAFWPGPLTMVLRRALHCPVSLLASAGLDTLAVRMPSHGVARELLLAVERPIAAPSANLSGKLSPTTALHVAESLGSKVDMILAGGKSQIGLESTVIDLSGEKPAILRPGGVTREQLEKILGPIAVSATEIADSEALPSPGMMTSHYAPNKPLRLNVLEPESDEAFLSFGPVIKLSGAEHFSLSAEGDLEEAAGNLFSMLRHADESDARGIAVMPIPEIGLGVAINDRLKRAAVR